MTLQHGDGDARHDIVALSPPELDDGLALRHFLNERQFLRLLPLIHFLREVTSDLRWRPPPLRACFIFDDPNLHRESYGFLAYGAMAAHARRHGYHAAIATIPFDGWYASPRAVRTFAANRDHLSLLVHGNDHVQALLSRALLRIARLEKKSGLSVARVMAAPHSSFGRTELRVLLRFGFEAALLGYMSNVASPNDALDRWLPGEQVEGLPVFRRRRVFEQRRDYVVRAFLDQPIVLYGHHQDAADDMRLLAERAAQINRLGDVRWLGMEQMSRSSFETRVAGDVLHVRPHARHVELEVPPGVGALRVDRRGTQHEPERMVVEVIERPASSPVTEMADPSARPAVADPPSTITRVSIGEQSEEIEVPACGRVVIKFLHPEAISHIDVRPKRRGVWPGVRRSVTEIRDRLQPYLPMRMSRR